MKKKKTLGRIAKRHRRISGVTERKTRQAATPRQADLLQRTFDSMTDAVFVLDAKLPVPTILECNQAASTIFGYDKREMLGKTTAFLHASDETLRKFQSLLYGAVKDGRLPFHLPEFRMKRRDGSVFPSEHSASQLVNERGDRIAWVSIVRDITEPKRMEEALRRRAEELAALQATVLDITGRQDLPTLLQAIVERAARLLDAHGGGMYLCDPERKEVRCVVSYNTPRDFTGTVLKYGEGAAGVLAQTGKPLIVDDYRTWQGRASVFEKEAPFSAVLSVPMMWQGRMTGVIDVLEDVKSRRFAQADLELLTMFANHAAIAVERRRAEEEITRQRDRAQAYLDVAGVMMVALDAEGRVTLLNRKGCEILGCSQEEVLGKNWADNFLPAAVRDQVQDVFRSLMAGKIELVKYFENPILTRSGEERLIAWHNTILRDPEGRVIGTLSSGNDITERKKAEEALRESEQQYRLLIERQREGLTIVDLEEQFVFCNPVGEEIFGVPRGKLVGRNLREFTSPETFELIRKQTERRRAGESSTYEVEIIRPDGGKRQLLATATPWTDKDGRIVGALAIFRDETDRKLAEGEIRKLSQFRESIIDNANIWLDVLDEKANVVIWNKAAEAMSGYAREEVVGHGRIWEWLYPDEQYRNEITAKVRAIMEKGEVFEDFETRIRRKDGQTRIISWHSRNLLDENGHPIGSVALGRDITEHKRMEEELRRYSNSLEQLVLERTKELRAATERLEYVISSNPAVIYTGRPLADHSDFVLTYLSERVVSMLGFEPREFIGHPDFWERHVPPEDVRYALAEMPRLWKEGQHTFEYRFLHKDGTYRWIREEAKVVRDVDGKPVEVNGYWTDVTERKRMEARLAESERLAAIGQTAAMVGHDLRNPLTGIRAAEYYLKTMWGPRLDPKANEMLKLIERDVEYSNKIIEDLLEYSREIRLDLVESTPRSITEDALGLVKPPRNVTILNLTAVTPRMTVDVEKVKRAFLNIIKNAFDAMPQGGKLTITSVEANGNVKVDFADTGTGMSKSTMEKLWSGPFTTKAKGIGLGLPISKRIIQAHGGSISMESETGRGTSFTVTLPIKPGPGMK